MTSMSSLSDLGPRVSVSQLAASLGIGVNSVYAHAQELGGVRIGRRWVFFENNVLDALRRTYANKQNQPQDKTAGVVRQSNDFGESVHEEMHVQEIGPGMGSAHASRNSNRDPYRCSFFQFLGLQDFL